MLDIPILPDDPTIRDYRVPKTVLVLEKTVKLLDETDSLNYPDFTLNSGTDLCSSRYD